MTRSATAVLTCHPDTRSVAVRTVAARVRWEPAGVLAITFFLEGDLARLQVPPPRPSRRVDGLWQHTCFEAFVALDAPAYHELNFAPSREWALYAFRDYREIAPLADEAWAPEITVHRTAGRLELAAVVRLDRLLPRHAHAPLRLALAAVVEDERGALSYWALQHPPGEPDFHHPDAFALQLAPPRVDSVNTPEQGRTS